MSAASRKSNSQAYSDQYSFEYDKANQKKKDKNKQNSSLHVSDGRNNNNKGGMRIDQSSIHSSL